MMDILNRRGILAAFMAMTRQGRRDFVTVGSTRHLHFRDSFAFAGGISSRPATDHRRKMESK
ncbi:hypothetical protein KUV89_00540 [Marinobacter hydrocarbonoclasticus]|nr:hypothetical protein [Marinobacter nauticus]